MVIYEYFEKPMSSNLVLEKCSALSENTRVSSLSQEVVRVLLNCSEDLEDEDRLKHLEHLCTKMKTSGYNTPYIRKLMVNGIKSYEKKLARSKLDKNDKNFAPLHLSKKYNANNRRDNKLLAKNKWYKAQATDEQVPEGWRKVDAGNGGRGPGHSKRPKRLESSKQKGPSTIMFVPWTMRGILVYKLRQEENRWAELTNFRIKYAEEGGVPLWRHFSTKLDEGLLCGRVKCTTCSQKDDKKVDCFSRSVVYESVCMLCHPDGKKPKKGDPMVMSGEGTYTGETSRYIFERAGEES